MSVYYTLTAMLIKNGEQGIVAGLRLYATIKNRGYATIYGVFF